MAAFDYATAAPLMAAVDDAWRDYLNFSNAMGEQLVNSAISPWIDVPDVGKLTEDLGTSIEALRAYIATLAPE